MYAPAGVKTSKDFPIPDTMKAWVLGDPGELKLTDKAIPVPKKAEVLVRIARPDVRLVMPRLGEVVEPVRVERVEAWWRGVDARASEPVLSGAR